MKKIIALLLVLVMALSLVACSKGALDENKGGAGAADDGFKVNQLHKSVCLKGDVLNR